MKNTLLFLKYFKNHCIGNKFRLMSFENAYEDGVKIFNDSVKAVQPWNLIRDTIKLTQNTLYIKETQVSLNQNVYVVGFGKAVLGMASALENIIGHHIISGIISIPKNIQKYSENLKDYHQVTSKIQVFEGAHNNIPDDDSLYAATKISELVASLDETNILFVLISGGGSALLPAPKLPLTLEEKQNVIKLLSSKGVSIEKINCIRKRLSSLKGGGLAKLARPAKVISLIISDIIDNPINLIASGPTIKNDDDPALPLKIIEHYDLKDDFPESALHLLENASNINEQDDENFDHVHNFIIGNNKIALNAAAISAHNLGYTPLIISSELRGNATLIGPKLIHFVNNALLHETTLLMQVYQELNLPFDTIDNVLKAAREYNINRKCFCLIFGGETTVEVKGKGIGGRNQELALAAAIEIAKLKLKSYITLLSAGTDGIDGPTDAAGAIANGFLGESAKAYGIDPINYLQENDSYSFYSFVENGQWHIKIGHTGTNVMDIIVILVSK